MADRVVKGSRTSDGKVFVAQVLRRSPTRAEKTLWLALRGNLLGGLHFRRQQIIAGFVADFYCHSAALVVEVDGAVHEGRQEYDEYRSLVFLERGIRVLRVSNQDVLGNLSHTLLRIFAAAERATPPSPSDSPPEALSVFSPGRSP